MTKQEAYEKIRDHFTQPGVKYGYNGYACVYRTEDGDRCAVGVLIPDDRYDSTLEGAAICANITNALGITGEVDLIDFLSDAQNIHDGMAKAGDSMWAFVARLDELAKENALEIPVTRIKEEELATAGD